MRATLTVSKTQVNDIIVQAIFKKVQDKLDNSDVLDYDLEDIKDRVLNRLRDWINNNRHRPMGTYNKNFQRLRRLSPTENLYKTFVLASSVVKARKGEYNLVIGDFDVLNQFASYWRVLNYGGYTPPATMGYFGDTRVRPKKNVTNLQVFHQTGYPASDGGKTWLMIPKQPITPMRYLSALNRIFKDEIRAYNFVNSLKKIVAQKGKWK